MPEPGIPYDETSRWGLAMDADELRLVWADMRGTALTSGRRLTVEQTLYKH